jgi:hypothetical protein
MRNAFVLASTTLLISGQAWASEIGQPEICKAAIAVLMGRDPATMKTDREADGITYFSYVRADDGSLWRYRCQLNGSIVVWASDTGPWRTRTGDEQITYVLASDRSQVTIKVMFSDGSSTDSVFTASQF